MSRFILFIGAPLFCLWKTCTVKLIFLFLLSFIINNWNDVSWVFNYKEVAGLTHDFFNPDQEDDVLLASANQIIATNYLVPIANASEKKAPLIVPTQKEYPSSDKSNSLEIPSINLVTSLVIGESTNLAILAKNLDQGAVYYPGSVSPGQNGQSIILGHSAPPNWPHIKHDWVFSEINSLNMGDQIILYYQNKQYSYRVIKKEIIDKGQDIEVNPLSANSNILTLVSCWPPGKNYQRITVQAQLIGNEFQTVP